MNHARPNPASMALELCAGDWAPAVVQAASAPGTTSPQDRVFIALQNAYRVHGGLSRLHGLNAGACVRSAGHGGDVEDLVAAGELFGVRWYRAMWIPMFQFAMPGPTVATAPRRVVVELGRSFDGWAVANWFVQPNAWLASHCPVECLNSHLPDVLEAARAYRLVTTGRAPTQRRGKP